MKVTVQMNPRALHTLSVCQTKALAMTAAELLSRARNESVIPFDTGNVQNEGTSVDAAKVAQGQVTITHDAPYAKRLYYHPEYNFNTSKNVNARGEWWEEWISGAKAKDPIKIFRTIYKKVTGGYVK